MWVAAGILAVAAALVLVAPITIELWLEGDAEPVAWFARVHMRWLGVSLRAESGRDAARGRTVPTPSPWNGSGDGRTAVRRWRGLSAALRSPGFARRVVGLMVDLLRLVRPDDCDVRARVGFDDPAATGLMAAALFPWAGPAEAHGIHVDLDFAGSTLEGRARLKWSRSLVSMARPLASFATSPAVWRAAGAYRRALR